MDQPPAVAFTAFADVWPRATGNGDRRRPMRPWRGSNFDFDFDIFLFLRLVFYTDDGSQELGPKRIDLSKYLVVS